MSESGNMPVMPGPKGIKRFNWRGFFSLLLFLSFLLLVFTGAILYVTPKGRVAHWTGWSVLGLEKEQWSAVHMTSALIVVTAAAFHLYFNWSIFWSYIKRKSRPALNLRREMALAVLVAVCIVVGTIYNLPPFGTIVRWNEHIKVYWEARSASAPTPHAEEFSIAQLAEEVEMPLEAVLARLEKAGINVDDSAVKVKDLAAANGLTPSELFAIARPETAPGVPRGGRGMGRGGGRGMGRGRAYSGYRQ